MSHPRRAAWQHLIDWGPMLVSPALWFAFTHGKWPPWAVMWGMAVLIYAGCKWLTWRQTRVNDAPGWKQAAYLIVWPGLDADAFLDARPLPDSDRPGRGEWLFAAVKLAFGLTLLFAVARRIPAEMPYVAGWIGMVGLIFTLHFGSFHLLSCAWRTAGVRAVSLMDWPILSKSVSEFWGQRWNRAFRDVIHRFLFRPLIRRIGAVAALLSGFLISGLVHDVVITIPADGGYGRPTAYFLIQGVALAIERSAGAVRIGLGAGWRGWLFAAAVTLGPVGLLFPEAFVVRIIYPFLKALGAVA